MKRYGIVLAFISGAVLLYLLLREPDPGFVEPIRPAVVFTEAAYAFIDGVAQVKHGRMGVINRQGQWVVPPRFRKIDYFSDGLAEVTFDYKKWGYIDKTGKLIVPCQLRSASTFRKEYARVSIDGCGAILDRRGNIWPLPTRTRLFGDCSEGLISFQDIPEYPIGTGMMGPGTIRPGMMGPGMGGPGMKGGMGPGTTLPTQPFTPGKFGFVNLQGQEVIKRQFEHASDFSEGLAAVQLNRKWGFIDKTGKMVIQPQWTGASGFKEGLAAVKLGNYWGAIDTTGQVVVEPKWEKNFGFKDGLARVESGRKYGFIDRAGNIVIEPQFDAIGSGTEDVYFSDGLQAVCIDEKWGFIDRTGKKVTELKFDELSRNYGLWFSEDLQAVRVGEKWGYIDRTGTFVLEPQFDEARNFSEGLAAVELGRKVWKHINLRYPLDVLEDGGSSYSKPTKTDVKYGKWGFIDKTGRLVIPPQFDDVSHFQGGVARVEVDNEYWFIDKTGKPLDVPPPPADLP